MLLINMVFLLSRNNTWL